MLIHLLYCEFFMKLQYSRWKKKWNERFLKFFVVLKKLSALYKTIKSRDFNTHVNLKSWLHFLGKVMNYSEEVCTSIPYNFIRIQDITWEFH